MATARIKFLLEGLDETLAALARVQQELDSIGSGGRSPGGVVMPGGGVAGGALGPGLPSAPGSPVTVHGQPTRTLDPAASLGGVAGTPVANAAAAIGQAASVPAASGPGAAGKGASGQGGGQASPTMAPGGSGFGGGSAPVPGVMPVGQISMKELITAAGVTQAVSQVTGLVGQAGATGFSAATEGKAPQWQGMIRPTATAGATVLGLIGGFIFSGGNPVVAGVSAVAAGQAADAWGAAHEAEFELSRMREATARKAEALGLTGDPGNSLKPELRAMDQGFRTGRVISPQFARSVRNSTSGEIYDETLEFLNTAQYSQRAIARRSRLPWLTAESSPKELLDLATMQAIDDPIAGLNHVRGLRQQAMNDGNFDFALQAAKREQTLERFATQAAVMETQGRRAGAGLMASLASAPFRGLAGVEDTQRAGAAASQVMRAKAGELLRVANAANSPLDQAKAAEMFAQADMMDSQLEMSRRGAVSGYNDAMYGAGMGAAEREFAIGVRSGESVSARSAQEAKRLKARRLEQEIARQRASGGISPEAEAAMQSEIAQLRQEAAVDAPDRARAANLATSLSRVTSLASISLAGQAGAALYGGLREQAKMASTEAASLREQAELYRQMAESSRAAGNAAEARKATEEQNSRSMQAQVKEAEAYLKTISAVAAVSQTRAVVEGQNYRIALAVGEGGINAARKLYTSIDAQATSLRDEERKLSDLRQRYSEDSEPVRAQQELIAGKRAQLAETQTQMGTMAISAQDREKSANLATRRALLSMGYGGSQGDMRKTIKEQMGLVDQQLNEQQAMRAEAERRGPLTASARAAFAEQRQGLIMQMAQLQEEYYEGFEGRIVSQVFNRPTGAGAMATANSTVMEASRAGVQHARFGGTEAQTRARRDQMYNLQERAVMPGNQPQGTGGRMAGAAMADGGNSEITITIRMVDGNGNSLRENRVPLSQANNIILESGNPHKRN